MKTESRTLLTIASSLIGSASADETLIPEEAQALIGINGGIQLLLEPVIPNPEPVTPLVLEVGKRYVCRNGEVTGHLTSCDGADDDFIFSAPVKDGRGNRAQFWLADGRFDTDAEYPLDLLSEYVEPDIRQRVSDLLVELEGCPTCVGSRSIVDRLREMLA